MAETPPFFFLTAVSVQERHNHAAVRRDIGGDLETQFEPAPGLRYQLAQHDLPLASVVQISAQLPENPC